MRGAKRTCRECGEKFHADNRLHMLCEDCQLNGPKRLRRLAQEERLQRLWTEWLEKQLKPFLGRKTVHVNELILHLREQAAKK